MEPQIGTPASDGIGKKRITQILWIGILICGFCILSSMLWKMAGCGDASATTKTGNSAASSSMPEGWKPEILPTCKEGEEPSSTCGREWDYTNAPDTKEYRKFTIHLRPGGYNDFYRLPAFVGQFSPSLSHNQGDWVSILCVGHTTPGAIRYWYQHDNNLGGTMDNCHDIGEKTDGFWIQGKAGATLTITVTQKKRTFLF